MSNLVTDWRLAVMAWLQTEFPDAEVDAGQKDGVNQRDVDLIRVWWPGWARSSRDASFATPTLHIRYFPSRSAKISDTEPRDPSDLEQAGTDLMIAFRDKRSVGDFVPGLACQITTVTVNDKPDQWYVEAVLQALTLHLATSAA